MRVKTGYGKQNREVLILFQTDRSLRVRRKFRVCPSSGTGGFLPRVNPEGSRAGADKGPSRHAKLVRNFYTAR